MAWTDYSTTLPESWSADIGAVRYSTAVQYTSTEPPGSILFVAQSAIGFISRLSVTYNIPGFEGSGYQPDGVNNPIQGDLGGGGGGGPTRPTSGFLYPRGQG
jgi:hypothetical protein